MYLKSIQIQGFKTFAERTQVHFTPGVTCVIGPNGSGKSNIADAILWVLGENNVRSLRGATSQDIIFAGNDKRRPLGMAEVSLTIDNSERVLPLDFTEITVTRRLYRSGEAECSINKVACRLRDIYELFLDTGIGRDAYSMIGQGEIDQILSVRSEDRRAVFEEAAGIKKYRVRRREAERKLEHTAQNLLRVNDIVAEIEGQLGPLQRQAAAATRYRELAGRLRVLETAFYGSRLRRLNADREMLTTLVRELTEERRRLDDELQSAQQAEKELSDAVQTLDQRADALRAVESAAQQRSGRLEAERARAEERGSETSRRMQALERELTELVSRTADQSRRLQEATAEEVTRKKELDAARTALQSAQNDGQSAMRAYDVTVRRLESLRLAWQERGRKRADLQSRLRSSEQRVQSLVQEQARARESFEDSQSELERLNVERESFLKAAAEHRTRAEALNAALAEARAGQAEHEQALRTTRSQADAAGRALASHEARLQALRELDQRGEGAAYGAKRLLAAARKGALAGRWTLFIEGLRVPEGLEKAVEAALGVYADALLCDSHEQAVTGLRYLQARKSAALILPEMPPEATVREDGLVLQLSGDPNALAWARVLMANTVLAEELTPSHLRSSTAALSVTREGQWWTANGAVSGGAVGAHGAAAATLTRKRELDTLTEALPEKEQAASEARKQVETADQALRKLLASTREQQSAHDAARLELQANTREAERRSADAERLKQRLNRLQGDLQRAEHDLRRTLESLKQLQSEWQSQPEAPTATEQDDPELVGARAEVGRLELERRKADTSVADARVRVAETEQRLQAALGAARRLADAGAHLEREHAARLREQETLRVEAASLGAILEGLRTEQSSANEEAAAAAGELSGVAEQRAEQMHALQQARHTAQDLGARLRELMERSHKADLELTSLEAQRRHLGQAWLDAAASAHSLEAVQEGDQDEPFDLTVEGLLAGWNAGEADLVLTSYGDPEAEINRLRRQIRALGAVNPDAVEQYAAAQERFDFLTSQRADLEAAREKLEGAIQEIDQASRETFIEAFRKIAEAFDRMFQKLFGGGTTELKLTDPHDVLETGIEVIVQPPGKKQQNLLLLSGGERALTAMALLFALLEIRPSPFCVLDEVDAPLDDNNVGRFVEVLRDFTGTTQFIVVTHNRGTMEGADTLYGVTMQERGVSKVLSCSLADPIVEQVAATSNATNS